MSATVLAPPRVRPASADRPAPPARLIRGAPPDGSGAQTKPAGELARPQQAAAPLRQPVETDTVALVRLYNAVEEATASGGRGIVQLVSAGSDGSHAELAYSLAWAGATLLGKRILFIDASRGTPSVATPGSASPARMRHNPVLGNDAVADSITQEANRSLFVVTLQQECIGGSAVIAARQIKTLLDELCASFDMILIAPTPTLEQPLAAILKTVVDGSILVIDAERSSARVSAECASLLSGGRTKLIGAVLRRRRNPVPRWLRRWF